MGGRPGGYKKKKGFRQGSSAGTEPPRLLVGIISGDGRQFQVKGLQFRVLEDCRCRAQVACGSGGKRFRLCRVRGNGRQGRHFHGETFDATAECSAGFFQQGGLMEPQAAGPGRTRRQKDNPSVAHVCEPSLARGRGGQEAAQSFIQRIEYARAIRERVEGDALRHGPRACGGSWVGTATWRHGEHELGAAA